ncbi:alkaline phosphatase family protein [Halocatena halophila]|uniref:hypothetical protein n=1 Tax=Halocatena halophila TaxID=2814576 RepID=UPI002ED00C01
MTSRITQRILDSLPFSRADINHVIFHPHAIISEINQRYNHWRVGEKYNPDGVDIFESDWDYFIILDACRYDEFVDRVELPGTTEKRTSRGSTSPEFVRGNFGGRKLHDVVYVTANNWFAKTKEEIDAEIYALESVEHDAGRTTSPETVTAAAREAAEKYPNKRIVVHYMQPHWPYLGPTGEKFADGPFHEVIKSTTATHQDVMQAYRENLDLVIQEVESLFSELSGKFIVSADHGELLGDRERPIPIKTYQHPEGVYVDGLITIPWHVYESGPRRTIVEDDPIETEEMDMETIEQQLEDLGYRV